jgi:hypothetical protein
MLLIGNIKRAFKTCREPQWRTKDGVAGCRQASGPGISPPTEDGTVQKIKRSIDMSKSRIFTFALSIVAVTALSMSRWAFAVDKPNIVMLMTDDTGWGDFGV